MARPSLPEAERKELKDKFVSYFRDVPVQKYAAMYIGVHENTVIEWMKADEDFSDRVKQARADWVKGRLIASKAEFALERLEKEVFRESKELEVTLPKPIMDLSDVRRDDSNQKDQTTDTES